MVNLTRKQVLIILGVFAAIITAIIVFFSFRESELNQQLNQVRNGLKKQLTEDRADKSTQAEKIENKAVRTITINKDRNETRKQTLIKNEKSPRITAPIGTGDILAIINSATRKL
jgi:Na+-translocating ferredoxin:NAD+ oxidoreductase RnfG subunit